MFSPLCLIYIYSQCSKGLCVRTSRTVIGWQTVKQSRITIQRTININPRWCSPSIQHPWTSTCVLFWQSLKRWHKQYAFHTHKQSAHTNTDTPARQTLTQWHRHKCLHMQESKNSLRSVFKNRPGENKRRTRWTESKCFDSLSFCIWLFVAVRQADRLAVKGRGTGDEKTRAASCTAVLLPLQLPPRLIRMRERVYSGGGKQTVHGPMVRNAALWFSSQTPQNSTV